jgi:hypothetical protein
LIRACRELPRQAGESFFKLPDMKTSIPSVLITFALVSVALVQNMQAVNPPPDGGYPGGNTAEGLNALLSLTSGTNNTAVGWFSLQGNVAGDLNTAVGAGTLFTNTGDNNTATGAGALFNNANGEANTASGVFALFDNTTGSFNTATGLAALGNNTTGRENTANGVDALLNNTIGGGNTASGKEALMGNTTGGFNTATGLNALLSNTDGGNNTADGMDALAHNTTGNANTATGVQAALFNTTGSGNTALGSNALEFNTTGGGNTALGQGAGSGVSTANNVICIDADGENVDNSCYIGQIFGQTSSGGAAVFINSNGRLGTITSSQRFKEGIKPIEQASEALYALKPVTFHYKKEIDPAGMTQFGLVAEDVEAINPDLVVHDKEGKPYSVRYDQVNTMLLNEFLKEHRTIQEQMAIIARLKSTIEKQDETNARQQKQIEILALGLQKVNARLEMSRPAPQVAESNY